jgi:hypothetical protein
MPFKSSQPDIDRKFLYHSQPPQPPQPTSTVPTNITTWSWLFSSPASPLSKNPDSEIAGFRNALTEQRISYSEVKRHTTHLSTALVKHHGLVKGDVVALFSPNTPWYPVAMLAVNRVAGIVSGASPAYNVEEMTYALKTAGAKYLFTVPGSMQVAAAAAKEAGIGREKVFLLEGKMEGFMGMGELVEQGRKESEQVMKYKLKDGEKNADLCGFLSFSSGTTGLPKAVSPPPFYSGSKRIIQEGKAQERADKRKGNDLPRQRNRSMPPNSPHHATNPQKDPRRAPCLPYNRPRTRPAPANPPERRSLHVIFLHHAFNALHHLQIQNLGTLARSADFD